MQLLFDQTSLNKLFQDYHSLLGMKIGLYDKNYQMVSLMPTTGWTFCNSIRQNPSIARACASCDIKAFKHVEKTRELYIYKCHMGLYEAVAPIIDKGHIIGFIMVGQLLDERSLDFQWLTVKKKCAHYHLKESDYRESFFALKQMNLKQIEAAANIMHACSAYLCYKNIMHVERSGLFPQIELYIEEHIKEAITQDDLCKKLAISKTTLYTIMMNNVSMSLTAYLQKLRMEKARLLLCNTQLKIKAISESVGINDYNYFSRLFKKTYHQTPSNYRKSNLTPL